jgi:hypothetical protein
MSPRVVDARNVLAVLSTAVALDDEIIAWLERKREAQAV